MNVLKVVIWNNEEGVYKEEDFMISEVKDFFLMFGEDKLILESMNRFLDLSKFDKERWIEVSLRREKFKGEDIYKPIRLKYAVMFNERMLGSYEEIN